MSWSVKDRSGAVREAITTEQLIWGLQRGELSADSWLRREGAGPWQPLVAVEAFGDIASRESASDDEPVPVSKLALGFGAVVFVFVVGWLLL